MKGLLRSAAAVMVMATVLASAAVTLACDSISMNDMTASAPNVSWGVPCVSGAVNFSSDWTAKWNIDNDGIDPASVGILWQVYQKDPDTNSLSVVYTTNWDNTCNTVGCNQTYTKSGTAYIGCFACLNENGHNYSYALRLIGGYGNRNPCSGTGNWTTSAVYSAYSVASCN